MTSTFFQSIIMSVTRLMNLLLPHPSWEVERRTAVFAERKSWGCFVLSVIVTVLVSSYHSSPVCVCIAEPLSSGPLCDCPLPNPEMSFHRWTDDLDICEWRWTLWGVEGKLFSPFSQVELLSDMIIWYFLSKTKMNKVKKPGLKENVL